MSDTENSQAEVRLDALPDKPNPQLKTKVGRSWLAESLIYLMLILAGALLAVASAYLMRKFGF